MKPKIFVTRNFPGSGIEILKKECDVNLWPGDDPPLRDDIIREVSGVSGIMSMLTDPIDQAVFDAAGPDLKVVSNYAVGFDNIDINSATAHKIPVGNTPDVLTDATADLAFALLMASARRIVEGADYARDGRWSSWSPDLLLGLEVKGATLGILGAGRIGLAMTKRAQGFDMDVLVHNRRPRKVEGARQVTFDELINKSDFLSLHVPLTEQTSHLIDKGVFDRMKLTAVLINTARGGVVDHDALFDALKEGSIAYAALDVTEPEPLPSSHRLYGLKNCLVVPHLGSSEVVTRSKMGVMAVDNLLAGLKGERLPNCVNPDVYEK